MNNDQQLALLLSGMSAMLGNIDSNTAMVCAELSDNTLRLGVFLFKSTSDENFDRAHSMAAQMLADLPEGTIDSVEIFEQVNPGITTFGTILFVRSEFQDALNIISAPRTKTN